MTTAPTAPHSVAQLDDYPEELLELAEAHHILEMEGHGDLTLGHLSWRDPEGRGFWMKVQGVGLGEVHAPADFLLIDFEGNIVIGDGWRHSEWPIHAEILQARPDVHAVGHTHPFHATAFSATDERLVPIGHEGSYFPGGVPHYKVTSGLVNTIALGAALASTLGDSSAAFMKNHGVVYCGGSIRHATLLGIFLEKACRHQLLLRGSGSLWQPPADDGDPDKSDILSPKLIDAFWAYKRRQLRLELQD